MNTEPKPEGAGRGLGEVSQDEIEKRAMELAHAKGSDTMDEDDLKAAQAEILGKSTTTAAPESSPKAQD